MFCSKCGGTVQPDERFCGQCGAPNSAPSTQSYMGYADNIPGISNKYDVFLKKLKHARLASYIGAAAVILIPFFAMIMLLLPRSSLSDIEKFSFDMGFDLSLATMNDSEKAIAIIGIIFAIIFASFEIIYFIVKASKLTKVIDAVALNKSLPEIHFLFSDCGRAGAIAILAYYIFISVISLSPLPIFTFSPIIVSCIMIINLKKFYNAEICNQR